MKNLIKFLRKPFMSSLLAFIILSTSCSQYDNDLNPINENIDLKTFVDRHLDTSTDIIRVLKSENLDLNFLEVTSKRQNVKIKELNTIFRNTGVQNSQTLSSLFSEIYENGKAFRSSNPDISENTVKKAMILALEKRQDDLTFGVMDACRDTYDNALDTCGTNFMIAMGVAAVGISAGGIGGAIGALVATLALAHCERSAHDDFIGCNGVNNHD